MKTIPQSYVKYHDTHDLVERDGDYVIYRRWREGQKKVCWEMMIVQHAKRTGFGVEEGDEYLPSSSTWGRLGWTCWSLEEARKKIEVLKAKSKNGTRAKEASDEEA